jgi:hypothetical protein
MIVMVNYWFQIVWKLKRREVANLIIMTFAHFSTYYLFIVLHSAAARHSQVHSFERCSSSRAAAIGNAPVTEEGRDQGATQSIEKEPLNCSMCMH